MKDQPEAEIST